MVTATVGASPRAARMSEMCPSCRKPIVGTSASVPSTRASWQARRKSRAVRTTGSTSAPYRKARRVRLLPARHRVELVRAVLGRRLAARGELHHRGPVLEAVRRRRERARPHFVAILRRRLADGAPELCEPLHELGL